MKQLTFATAGFERYAKTTRRATFLGEMEQVVPWRRLCRLIEPVYPKAGNGRPPVGLERMLRIYFLPSTGSTCLTLRSRRPSTYFAVDAWFRRHRLGAPEPVPDETTVVAASATCCEEHDELAAACSRRSIAISRRAGSRWPRAPSSMRRSHLARHRRQEPDQARDPDMHQTKGNQWYFGIEGPYRRRQPGQDHPRRRGYRSPMSPTARCGGPCCMARRRGVWRRSGLLRSD